MATTLLPGLFWLVAARRNWPLPLSTELIPRRPLLAAGTVVSLLFVLLAASVAVSFMLPWFYDCSGIPLLDENGEPQFIDFTARILFVGPNSLYGCSLFSIARVEERFSDSIWVVPKFVILRVVSVQVTKGRSFSSKETAVPVRSPVFSRSLNELHVVTLTE